MRLGAIGPFGNDRSWWQVSAPRKGWMVSGADNSSQGPPTSAIDPIVLKNFERRFCV